MFHTQAKANGKLIKVIIDGDSYHNLASKEMCEKLGLTMIKRPRPYHVQWLSDCGDVKVQHMVRVTFSIHDYTDIELLPMTPTQIMVANMQKKLSESEREKKTLVLSKNL